MLSGNQKDEDIIKIVKNDNREMIIADGDDQKVPVPGGSEAGEKE